MIPTRLWARIRIHAAKIGIGRSISRPVRYFALSAIMWSINITRSLLRTTGAGRGAVARGGALILVSLLISYAINNVVNAANISYGAFSTFFVTIGATLTGVVAIVLALSIFAQERAAEIYSSGYFKVYIYDIKHKLIYSVIVLISLVFFAGAFLCAGSPTLYHGLKSTLIYVTMALVAIVFWFVDWQYQLVISKVDPMKGIAYLEQSCANLFQKMNRDLNRIINLLQYKYPEYPSDLARQEVFNKYYKPQLTPVEGRIENLFEMALRLANRRESMPTRAALQAVQTIVAKYLDLRKTSSVAFPSAGIFLAYESDSQDLLSTIFAKFNDVSEDFIREGRNEYVLTVLDIYGVMGKSAADIKFSNAPTNPVFDQIVGFLGILGDRGMRTNDQEIVLRFSQVVGELSLLAVEKNLYIVALQLLLKNLLESAEWGIKHKATFITSNCYNSWHDVLIAAFRPHFYDTSAVIKKISASINTITAMSFFATASGFVPNDVGTGLPLLEGYGNFEGVFSILLSNYEQLVDPQEKKYYRSHIVYLLEELSTQLRQLSESIKNCDSPLTNTIADLIYNCILLIISLHNKQEFADQSEQLERRLGWLIWLPGWFVHHAGRIDNMVLFDSIPDAVVQSGLVLLDQSWVFKLKIEVVDAHYSIIKGVLARDTSRHGYDEPRLMTKMCMLGILALKQNEKGVFQHIALKIFEFEDLYYKEIISAIEIPAGLTRKKISGVPDKDQLKIDLFRWREEFIQKQRSGFFTADPIEAKLLGEIHENDIDAFIFNVWAEIPPASKASIDLKRKTSMRKALKKLYWAHKKQAGTREPIAKPRGK